MAQVGQFAVAMRWPHCLWYRVTYGDGLRFHGARSAPNGFRAHAPPS